MEAFPEPESQFLSELAVLPHKREKIEHLSQ